MNKFSFYIIFMLCFCTSCKNNKTVKIIENKYINLDINRTNITSLLCADKMKIIDSYLILIDRCEEPIFHVYELSNYSHIKSFGLQGNGPTDYIFPFFLNNNDNNLITYDVNLAQFKDINIKNLKNGKGDFIESREMPKELIGCPDLINIGDEYYGNIDTSKGLYFHYSDKEKKIEWVNFPNSLLSYEEIEPMPLNMSRIAINPKKNIIACAMYYYNKIFLYTTKGDLIKEIIIGDKEITPQISKSTRIIKGDSKICFSDIYATDKYIYLITQEIKYQDFEERFKYPSRIIILDWNLNYISTLTSNKHIYSITIDNKHKRLIYIAINQEGDPEILYHQIK